MLRDVKHTVTDVLLGFATATGDGKSLKIGVSPIVSDTPIIITGDMDATKIKDRLGLSPLADAVMDSVQFGASRIYCLPYLPMQGGVLPFQRLDLVTAEKRTDALGDVGGCGGCRPFQLLGLYFFFRPS